MSERVRAFADATGVRNEMELVNESMLHQRDVERAVAVLQETLTASA